MKDMLDLDLVTADEIVALLDAADAMREILTRPIRRTPALRGKTVVNLFYEPSTRTRVAFELAAKNLSADVVNVAASGSSVEKGESLVDTARTLEALGADFIVMRHPLAGAPYLVADNVRASVINAGDGWHAHPTQALLDLYTIRARLGQVAGLRVVIVGDVWHSRVARSNAWGLAKLGASVVFCGPPTLLPPPAAIAAMHGARPLEARHEVARGDASRPDLPVGSNGEAGHAAGIATARPGEEAPATSPGRVAYGDCPGGSPRVTVTDPSAPAGGGSSPYTGSGGHVPGGVFSRLSTPHSALVSGCPQDDDLLPPAEIEECLDRAIAGADVVMALRLQRERQAAGLLPSLREYIRLYQVNAARLATARPGALVMHPGPRNEGIELAEDLARSTQSVIEEQVTNGVAVRMALLYRLAEARYGAASLADGGR